MEGDRSGEGGGEGEGEGGGGGGGVPVVLHVYDVKLPSAPQEEGQTSGSSGSGQQVATRRQGGGGGGGGGGNDTNGTYVNNFVTRFNKFFGNDLRVMGVFHTGVEIAGEEWGYGYCERGSGVYRVRPSRNPMYEYRFAIPLGRTPLGEADVKRALAAARQDWQGKHYHLLARNCNHFSAHLARQLMVGDRFPTFVNRLANFGHGCVTTADYVYESAKSISNEISGCFQMALSSTTNAARMSSRAAIAAGAQTAAASATGNGNGNAAAAAARGRGVHENGDESRRALLAVGGTAGDNGDDERDTLGCAAHSPSSAQGMSRTRAENATGDAQPAGGGLLLLPIVASEDNT